MQNGIALLDVTVTPTSIITNTVHKQPDHFINLYVLVTKFML